MYGLNHRIGTLFRQNQQKKSYEMRYFFIDDQANILQKAIRISRNFAEVKQRLNQLGQKSFSLFRYNISNVKQYYSQAILPFSNRTYFELKQKDSNGDKNYYLFGLADEDTALLHEQIIKLTKKVKKANDEKTKKVIIEEQNEKQQQLMTQFFKRFLDNQQKFKMADFGENGRSDIQYQGQFLNIQRSKAHGRGKQILISQGITYSGQFSNGMKKGTGYLVNSNLDTINCDFIDDELVGI